MLVFSALQLGCRDTASDSGPTLESTGRENISFAQSAGSIDGSAIQVMLTAQHRRISIKAESTIFYRIPGRKYNA